MAYRRLKTSAFLLTSLIYAAISMSRVGGSISLFTEEEELVMDGDAGCEKGLFSKPLKVTCACLKGIYSFFEQACSSNFTWTTFGGDNHCFAMPDSSKIDRVEFLNNGSGRLMTVIDSKYKTVKARYNTSENLPLFRKGDILVIVDSWTLLTPDGRIICVISPPGQYCFFDKVPKFLAFRTGCHGQGKKEISPTTCKSIKKTNNITSGCPGQRIEATQNDRQKREINGPSLPPGDLDVKSEPKLPEPNPREEDFGIKPAQGSSIVKSEIWNYATENALRIVRNSNSTQTRVYQTPAYEMLQLSKKIIMKSCPTFMVPKYHWEMAVTTFISMQQRSFKFRERFIELKELEKIKDRLELCLNETVEIPFIPPNETCVNGTTVLKWEEGMYMALTGDPLPLVLAEDDTSHKNEPFTETVWKMYVHVLSQCHKYFNDSTTEHHLLKVHLLSLFTNDAWNIWMKDDGGKNYELKKDVYGGILGDGRRLMANVDYCGMYPILEYSYPHPPVRPKAEEPVFTRRRRSLDEEGDETGVGTCVSIREGSGC